MIIVNIGDIRMEGEKMVKMNNKKWINCMNEILITNETNDIVELENEIERVNEMCSITANKKMIKTNGWWNKEIEFWYERKRIALRDFNRCIYYECKRTYEKMNGRLKKAIRRAKRISWRKYVSQMTHRTTTKDLWDQFNRVKGKKCIQRNVVLDDREKGNQFLQMILNVKLNLENLTDYVSPDYAIEGLNEMCDQFKWDEFLWVLENSKSTTPGLNRVTYKMIAELKFEAKKTLLRILNKAWMNIQIPTNWKESRVVPIAKKDRDINMATNYRGICMLNVLMKIMNGMMKGRMEKFVNENNLLPETTFGFRRNHSANECVEKFIWEIRKENKKVVAVFLDIERAYDYVIPGKLSQILKNMCFPGKICKWIYEFMNERKLILCGRDYRLEGTVKIGLPQGSKISPILFNLYTSSIHHGNSENKVILQFADDFVILGKGKKLSQAMNRAKECLDQVVLDLTKLNLRVNIRKCCSMGFRTNERIDMRIYNVCIENVNVTRYLGIWIDRKLNFKKHMEILADDCKNRLNIIKRVSKPKWGAHPGVTDMIRKALVSSKIAYGMSVYGDGSKTGFERLMKIENACARVVLGAINSTPIHTLWSEMGDSPLDYKREWIIVRETVRMILSNNCLVNEMIARLQSGTNFKNTQRTRLILGNMVLFNKIGKNVPTVPPSNLVVYLKFGDTNKNMMNELAVKQIFQKIRMNTSTYVEVYTDASVNNERVGVGINIPSIKKEKMFRIDDSICIMNAELIGIIEGIKLAMNDRPKNVIVFSDSLSALKLISIGGGTRGNTYVSLLYEYLQTCGSEVILQWIPSHLQIEGNERADMIAKMGCVCENVLEFVNMDARDVLRMFQVNLWRKWENEYVTKGQIKGKKYFELCNTPLRKPFYKELKGDTTMIRTLERVRLNHGNWKECLYKRQLSECNICECCAVVEDIEHILLRCIKFNQNRGMFGVLNNARNLTEVLRMGNNIYKDMYEFIKLNGIIV